MLTEILLLKINGVAAGSLLPDQPPGSLTLPPPPGETGRPRMLLFGWIDGEPGVWESLMAWHTEAGAPVRVVGSAALRRLSMLTEPLELDYWPLTRPRMMAKLRFELVGPDA